MKTASAMLCWLLLALVFAVGSALAWPDDYRPADRVTVQRAALRLQPAHRLEVQRSLARRSQMKADDKPIDINRLVLPFDAGEGVELQEALAEHEEGRVFGFSRTGAATSAAVSKNQVIGKLTLKAKAEGTSEIRFDIDRSRIVSENLERIEVEDRISGAIEVK